MSFGNWDVIYKLGLEGGEERIGWGITSIKHEIVYNGIVQGGLQLDVPIYGVGTESKVKTFQKLNGLAVDGQVGPLTAHQLFKKRTHAIEVKYSIEAGLLCKLKNLESADFPSCVSVNSPTNRDRGQLQINNVAHTDVSDYEAFNFPFAIDWAGRHLNYLHSIFGNWDDALAAYNVGEAGAHAWIAAGRPADSKAAQYIRVVRSRTC